MCLNLSIDTFNAHTITHLFFVRMLHTTANDLNGNVILHIKRPLSK